MSAGSAESWERDMTVTVGDIPYDNIGSGDQSILQSQISVIANSAKDAGHKLVVMLFEEPENHLSYANLNKLLSFIGSLGEMQSVCTTHSSFVANKLGIERVTVVGGDGTKVTTTSLKDLDKDVYDFFRKLPGYETLRLVLVDEAILVEGPSDELVVQRAFRDKFGFLPIEKGVDIISVGLSFDRFLPIAERLSKRVAVVTDNDGKPKALDKKYGRYAGSNYVKVCYEAITHGNPPINLPRLRMDTLEPELVRNNGLEKLGPVVSKTREFKTEEELMWYMESHKSECALSIFDSPVAIEYPAYIKRAIDWVCDNG